MVLLQAFSIFLVGVFGLVTGIVLTALAARGIVALVWRGMTAGMRTLAPAPAPRANNVVMFTPRRPAAFRAVEADDALQHEAA